MTTVRIKLPFPPSLHRLRFRSGAPTPAYQQWRKEAGHMLNAQKPRSILGRVNISIALVAPDNRHRDADNLLKAPIDLLVKHGVLADDWRKHVREARAFWEDEGDPCTVTITATEASRPMSLATTEGGSHHQPKEKANG